MEKQTHIIKTFNQWIGLRENLQETIDFPIKYFPLIQSIDLNTSENRDSGIHCTVRHWGAFAAIIFAGLKDGEPAKLYLP